MEKIIITEEFERDCRESELELTKNLTFEEVQEINDSIASLKEDHLDATSKIKKDTIGVVFSIFFGIVFVLNYGILLLIPLVIGLSFFVFRIFKNHEKNKFVVSMRISLEATKEAYLQLNS